jgi:hypothetical protein
MIHVLTCSMLPEGFIECCFNTSAVRKILLLPGAVVVIKIPNLRLISRSKLPVVIKFYSEKCSHCRNRYLFCICFLNL